MKTIFIKVLLIVSLLGVTSCSSESVKSESELDIPEYHYKLGVRKLDDGRLQEALSAFQRSIDLDPKFAVGWGGLGLTQTYVEDVETGKKSVDKAVDLADKNSVVWVWRGRFWTVSKNEKKWLEKAEKDFKRSLEISPGNEEAEYYLGEAYFQAYDFRGAESQFAKVVALKGELAKKANEKWELSQKVVRASPGTLAGKKIAIQPKVSRADLAVLFTEEMKLVEVFERFNPTTTAPAEFKTPEEMMNSDEEASSPPDIVGFWAEPWIMEVLELGVLEVDPEGKFNPRKTITRVEYAMAVQRILSKITGDGSLETKYFGEATSRFSDVPSTHFAYNAMALCVERGIMKVDMMTGKFDPVGVVSGADALLIIREIQNSLRLTF